MIRISAFADEISEDPAEQLDCLGALGVKHVEFRSIFGTNVLDLSDAQHEAFRAMLATRGVTLSAIGSPIGKIAVTDPFEPHLARFGRAMHLAEFHGTPLIRVFSYYIPKGDDPARHRDEVLRRMSAKAELARKRGLMLVLENEEGIYGDNAARVLDLLDSVGSPALSHAFDPANYLIIGQPIAEAWELLRDRVGHVHVKDYDPLSRTFVVAGRGGGLFPTILADASGAATTASPRWSPTCSWPNRPEVSPDPTASATRPAPSRASSIAQGCPLPDRAIPSTPELE